MKKTILAIAFIAISTISCKTEKNKVATKDEVKEVKKTESVINTHKANVLESKLTWKGSKPTGTHEGTVNLDRGFIQLENGALKSGEFVIDMKTITCTDLKAEEGKEKLEGHLASADFFDIEKFPTAKFVIASSEAKDGKLNVTGNLTIKGVTKSVTIPASIITGADGEATFKSDSFSIDRTDFGVTYSSKKFDAALKDKFINDLMELTFEIKTKK